MVVSLIFEYHLMFMRFPRFGPFARVVSRLLMVLACGVLAGGAVGQNFPQPKVIATGNWPAAVYTADVNGDGIPDLIYVDQGATAAQVSTTHVLLGDGHGNFTRTATIATVGASLAIADMDGNGTADVVWVGTAGPQPGAGTNVIGSYTVFVAYGNGNGTFQGPSTYGTPVYLTPYNPPLSTFRLDHVAVGHFYQKTGPLDVVYEETSQDVLCKVAGTLSLGSGCVGLPAGTGPILVSDLNGDGYQDLMMQQSNTNVLTLLGGARFGYTNAAMVSFSGVSGIHSSFVQDVNGDGRPTWSQRERTDTSTCSSAMAMARSRRPPPAARERWTGRPATAGT